MSEDRATYQAANQVLHLKLSLTPKCHVDLTIQGDITRQAIDRLIKFLELAVYEPARAEESTDGR